jgi:uncharacterized membrane protein
MTFPAGRAAWAAIGVGYLAGFIVYPYLPGPSLLSVGLPAALARPLIAFALPIAATLIYLILRRLWNEATTDGPVAPDGFAEAIHQAIAVRVVLFVTAIHVLVVLNLSGVGWIRAAGPRLVVVLLGGVFIAVGNLLPRTRPNLAVGIRTARTLSDRGVWIRLHRTCGYVAVAFGTVVIVSGLVLAGPTIGVVVGMTGLASIGWLALSYRRLSHA